MPVVSQLYYIFLSFPFQITIGRTGEVTYAILSPMISRCHAIIKRQEDTNTWSITDNKVGFCSGLLPMVGLEPESTESSYLFSFLFF